MYIYALTEPNVNGCGEAATEYARFPAELTLQQESQLMDALTAAKSRAKSDGKRLDTGQLVDLALQAFESWTGIHGEHIASPVHKEITF